MTDYRCPECGTVAENVKLPRGEVMVCGNRAHGYYMPTMLLVEEPGAKSNADAFRKNLEHEVDGLHRQAEADEKRLAAMQWAPAGDGEELPITVAPVSTLPTTRPVCACGQTVWNGARGYDGRAMCSDCSGDYAQACFGVAAQSLDARISAATVSPVTTRGAWDWCAEDVEYEL